MRGSRAAPGPGEFVGLGRLVVAAFVAACSPRARNDAGDTPRAPSPDVLAPPAVAPGVEPRSGTQSGDSDGSGVERLRRDLASPDQEIRLAAVHSLAERGGEAQIEPLIDALRDVDFRVRRDAAAALGELGPEAEQAVPALAALLTDSYAFVRERALIALTRVGSDRALDAVLAWTRGVDPDSIDQALDALGSFGDSRAIPEIRPWAESLDTYLRRSAARALVRIGSASAPVFRELVSHADPGVRCTAIRGLAIVGEATDLDVAERLARGDTSPVVRLCASGALGRLGDPDAVGLLDDRVADLDPAIREAAVEGLALIGTQAAVNRLIDALPLLQDPADEIPNPAMQALVGLDEAARPTLAVRITGADGELARLLAQTIAVTGLPGDIDALDQALQGQQDPVVRAAIEDAISAIRARNRTEGPDGGSGQ